MRQSGVRVVEGVGSGRWLRGNLKKGDVVHFHWPSFSEATSLNKTSLLLGFLRFVALVLLMCFKRAGVV